MINELKQRRQLLNMTQSEVAELSGISRVYYVNIEAGRKRPSLNVAKKIADTLQTTVECIFFKVDVPKRNTG